MKRNIRYTKLPDEVVPDTNPAGWGYSAYHEIGLEICLCSGQRTIKMLKHEEYIIDIDPLYDKVED